MPSIILTDHKIRAMAEGEELWDSLVPGALLIRRKKNRWPWHGNHRGGGKQHRPLLGYYPELTIKAARQAAREAKERFLAGVAAVPATPHPSSPDAVTFGGYLDDYEQRRLRQGGRGTKTLSNGLRLLRIEYARYLNLPLRALTRADVISVRDRMVDRGAPIQAGLILSYLHNALDHALERGLVEHNVAHRVRKVPGKSRDRVLSADELRNLFHACDRMPGVTGESFGRLVKFLALTAQRRGEVATLKYGDIAGLPVGNVEPLRTVWRQLVNKADRPHSVPLSRQAIALLGSGPADAYCFPSGDGGPIRGFSSLLIRLRSLGAPADATLHDLRRTAASGMGDLSIGDEAIRSVLNHATAGVLGTYQRSERDLEKAAALRAWGAHVQSIVAEAAALAEPGTAIAG